MNIDNISNNAWNQMVKYRIARHDLYFIGKNSHYLPQLLRKHAFPPWTLKPGKPPPWTFKTIRFTSLTSYKRFSKTILSFSFLFISVEYLKNHSKSHKNHKIEILILFDSTWVNLHSTYIIWYALVQIFYCIFRSILFCN